MIENKNVLSNQDILYNLVGIAHGDKCDLSINLSHGNYRISAMLDLNPLYFMNENSHSFTIKKAVLSRSTDSKTLCVVYNNFDFRVHLNLTDIDDMRRKITYHSFCEDISFVTREKLHLVKERYRTEENKMEFEEYKKSLYLCLIEKDPNLIRYLQDIYDLISKDINKNKSSFEEILK